MHVIKVQFEDRVNGKYNFTDMSSYLSNYFSFYKKNNILVKMLSLFCDF